MFDDWCTGTFELQSQVPAVIEFLLPRIHVNRSIFEGKGGLMPHGIELREDDRIVTKIDIFQ